MFAAAKQKYPLISKIALVIVYLFLVGCQKNMDPVDFNQLTLPSSPNYALLAPQGYEPSPFMPALKFALPPRQTAEIITNYIKQQPRITVLSEEWDTLSFSYIQRTFFFRFPDQVDIKIISLGDNQSSYIMLSRSQYGYSDFGKNRKRLSEWQNQLKKNAQVIKP